MLNYIIIAIQHYGLWGIFLSHVIESAGVPFPTEAAFVVSLELINSQAVSFWQMYWFVVFSQVAGSVFSYYVGIFLEDSLSRWFKKSQGYVEASAKINQWYKKYGPPTIFGARLIGYVRPWSSLVAGFADMPFWPFFLWTVSGTMLFVYIGLRLTTFLSTVWYRYPISQPIITGAVIIGFFAGIVAAIVKSRQAKNDKTNDQKPAKS